MSGSARRRILVGVSLSLGAVVLSLLLGEGVIRLFGFDLSLLAKVAPRMIYETEIHRPVSDPWLLLDMKPGATARYDGPFGEFAVHVNQLGFRGGERRIEKAPGVFRILCVGGSNVYGAGLDDDDTWPAKLEALLNATPPGRFEVWNLGVSGYNSLNMAAVARNASERFDPDLILVAPSNIGPRFFLEGTEDLQAYYREDETLWLDLFPPERMLLSPPLSQGTELFLMNHVRLYRYLMLVRLSRGATQDRRDQGLISVSQFHTDDPTRSVLRELSRSVPVALLMAPFVQEAAFEGIHRGLELPVLRLDASGLPPEYLEWHPSAEVMDWYVRSIARLLVEMKLLPG